MEAITFRALGAWPLPEKLGISAEAAIAQAIQEGLQLGRNSHMVDRHRINHRIRSQPFIPQLLEIIMDDTFAPLFPAFKTRNTRAEFLALNGI